MSTNINTLVAALWLHFVRPLMIGSTAIALGATVFLGVMGAINSLNLTLWQAFFGVVALVIAWAIGVGLDDSLFKKD